MPRRAPRTAKPIPDATERRDTLQEVIRFPHDRDFVWVDALRLTDGTRIDLFVHAWTGRELLLGDDGAIFGITPSGRLKAVDRDEAMWRLIPHRSEWLEMGGYVSADVGPEPCPEDEEHELWPDTIPAAWLAP